MKLDLEDIFEEVAQQMQSKFRQAQKAIQHNGIKGNMNETIVCEFLRQYLPKSLDISTGELVDSYGGRSKQIDVIISDAFRTPIFYKLSDIRVIPIECTYSIIEVKANLDTKELEKTFENMKSVRSLQKKAFFRSDPHAGIITSYGQKSQVWPVNYFIFAFDSISLDYLRKSIENLHQAEQLPLSSRIDTVCVLKKGIIANMNKKPFRSIVATSEKHNFSPEELETLPEFVFSLNVLPDQTTELFALPTNNALLAFYMLITAVLHQANMPFFNIIDYMPFHPY